MRTFLHRLVLSVVVAACLSASYVAQAQGPVPHLAPEVLAQLAALIAQKQKRTADEAKLDSNLLFAMRAVMTRQLGKVDSLPPYIDAFIRAKVAAVDNTVAVTIRAAVSGDLITALEGVGGQDINAFPEYDRITARLPVTQLRTVAQRADVRFIAPTEKPHTSRYQPAVAQVRERLKSSPNLRPKIGAVTSEGVNAHQANRVIETGIDGTGVMICVISDGIDSLSARQATGDLPPVVVVGPKGAGDEGTAMLEIIHDMAPGAELGFASGISEPQMATNIDTLRMVGCDIIVDDVVWPGESTFQDGPIGLAINTFTAAGRTYFSSATNYGNATHATSGTWEGDFVDSGMQNAVINAFEGQPVKLNLFGSLADNKLLTSPRVLSLQWSDPLGSSANDYDLFVLNDSGTTILSSSTTIQSGSQDPVEVISCNVSTCPAGGIVVVALYSGVPRALRLQAFSTGAVPKLASHSSGGAFGHNAAAHTITIAAVNVANAPGGVFTGGTNFDVEDYSSDGLRHLFYNSNGSAITPGNLLFGTGGGAALAKVDLTAADGVRTATTAYDPFFGTSAAAAHAAAIAALVKSANQWVSPATIKSALLASALDIQATGNDRDSGVGIVMAPASVRAVVTPLSVNKNFVTSQIQPGGTSTLTITLANSNSVRLKGVSFTNTYPTSIVNAPSPAAQISGAGCGGTLGASPGGGSVSLSSGTVPAFTTCTITVKVTGSTPNTYVDSSGGVTTPMGLNSPAVTAMLTIATGQAPSMLSAASRRVHSAAGTFDLPLSLIPTNPTTEPRRGPASTIVLTFDRAITGASVAITEGIATPSAPVFNGNDVIVNLSGVVNAQYVKVALTNVSSADGGTGGSGSVRIGFLAGDVNGNRNVSLSDVLWADAALSQTVSTSNFLRDVNASGTLSLSDLLVIDAYLSQTLPAP